MQGRFARQAESLFQWRARNGETSREDRTTVAEAALDPADDSLELCFVLADPNVSLADLFNLTPGDLLLLDEPEGAPLRVYVNREAWGSAVIGWDGDEPAVRLIKEPS